MEDKFKEFGCEFKNESDCEEELDEDNLDLEEAERKHFNDDGEN